VWGLFAPTKTPIVAQCADWFTAAMWAPEVKAKLNAQGSFRSDRPQRISPRLRRQFGYYGQIIREANIKAE
jgi:tripartite-type tricarboxylate transporter receptor subunit TctC